MSPGARRRLLTFGLGLTLLVVHSVPALAQDDGDVPAGEVPVDEERAPISLRLTPAILEVAHESDRSTQELRLDNTGSQPLQVVADTVEFTVTPEGATRFAGPEEVGAAGWVEIDTPEFELAPDEAQQVEVAVEVPEDAEPGERYVSVVFAVPGADDEGNVVVTHRVAAKLYIEVPGEQIHDLAFGEFSAPWLVDSRAATFELEVENRGNIHRRFEDPDQLVASSGDARFPFQNFTVLGDSTRVVEAVWTDPPLVCWCTVEVATDDGQGELATASTRVLMFPLRLALALLALVAGLAMLSAARRRRQAAHLELQLEQARTEGAQSAASATASQFSDLPQGRGGPGS